jgi:hypothetical protein
MSMSTHVASLCVWESSHCPNLSDRRGVAARELLAMLVFAFPYETSHLMLSSVDPRAWSSLVYLILIGTLLAFHLMLNSTGARAEGVLGEICLVLPMGMLYFLARGLTHADPSRAFANAESIVALEERLGVFLEPRMQGAVLDSPLAVHVVNWIYVWGHWPAIISVLLWLWYRHPSSYVLNRNAMLFSGVIGIFIFTIHPVAPPRLVPSLDLTDTVLLQSRSYRVLQPPALANQFAAMPSLHLGWNAIVGMAIVTNARQRLGQWLGYLLPIAMFAAIILTANHFILDGIVGILVATTGWGLAKGLAAGRIPDSLSILESRTR